ncbi:MAG TPA: aconitase/3-isopropylmalate dehydratase large subunit family protein [Stellaceae bacterium]|jgi:3-isopropylmalate/(R)-2-methylmalate dehydratase large subunit|nr:aconitase/3-isopropylmalate dehydratase large subunit family protein [Stellaceae bacterium]
MGMTIVEKIFARASGQPRVAAGDLVVVNVNCAVMLDMSFHRNQRRNILKVHDPDKVAVVYDHMVPAPDKDSAEAHAYGREFVRRFGIKRFHDVGPEQGISHAVVADRAYALPGSVLVCSDSHTCASGAFNCAARGIGGPDLIAAVTTGKTWYRVGKTIRYDFHGSLRPGVSAKDLFLYLAGTWGHHTNQNVEFGGPGLAGLSIDSRRTIAAMGAELSAEFATFEADERLIDYVKARNPAPFTPQSPDADADYAERREVDLGTLRPLVALPDAVIRNSVPVDQVAGEKIDQAFIGSCANGTLEDLAEAARVVKGRKVAAGVRLLVTPSTQAVYSAALKAGYIETLVDAGAVVTSATCGACFGGHMGVLGPGETCITASTRNFKGRMGDPTARIYMASPATVAASALAGHIAAAGEPA